MAKDYTMRPSKESAISNNRQRMAQDQRSETDMAVKRNQDALKKYQGRPPVMQSRFYEFNANMMNNGAHAQEFAKSLTKGIDTTAFPVKQNVDTSQD